MYQIGSKIGSTTFKFIFVYRFRSCYFSASVCSLQLYLREHEIKQRADIPQFDLYRLPTFLTLNSLEKKIRNRLLRESAAVHVCLQFLPTTYCNIQLRVFLMLSIISLIHDLPILQVKVIATHIDINACTDKTTQLCMQTYSISMNSFGKCVI